MALLRSALTFAKGSPLAQNQRSQLRVAMYLLPKSAGGANIMLRLQGF